MINGVNVNVNNVKLVGVSVDVDGMIIDSTGGKFYEVINEKESFLLFYSTKTQVT